MSTLRRIFRPFTHDRHEFVRAFASSLRDGSDVLDVGAGSCKYRALFGRCNYKAQDFAQYPHADHSYGTLDYISDITAIPTDHGSFDAILCTEVLEHVPRPDLALQEFVRILRPGGQLLLTAPMRSGIHMAPYHFYGGFTRYWYEHFLPMHGFEIRRIEENGKFFRYYGGLSQQFLRRATPSSALGRFLFLPFKLILSLWFRLLVPVLGYFLDENVFDHREDTQGYFVLAMRVGSREQGD